MAERVGFEPTTLLAQSCSLATAAFNRSATSPLEHGQPTIWRALGYVEIQNNIRQSFENQNGYTHRSPMHEYRLHNENTQRDSRPKPASIECAGQTRSIPADYAGWLPVAIDTPDAVLFAACV